jgi:hypothetical protein
MKDTTINVVKVVGVNAAALSNMFTHVNEVLTAISLTLASAYTIYKFVKDWQNGKLNS